jgi:hypothetical protein
VKQCPMCEGKGQRLRNSFVDPTKDVERWCEACKGTGSLPPDVDELQATIAPLRAQLAALQREHAASAARVDARVAAMQADSDAIGVHAYASSDKHLSGYRLTIGFDTLEQVCAAHQAVANCGKRLAQPDAARAAGERE